MFEKFIVPIVAGVLSTLISNWITGTWTNLNPQNRWLVSGIIGIVAIATAAFVTRRSKSGPSDSVTNVATNLHGDNVRIKDIETSTGSKEALNVASDVKATKGDVDISKVKVRRGKGGE